MKEITITNEKFSNPLETNEVNVKVEPQMEEVNAIDCNKFANKTTGKSNSDMEATAHKVASDVIKAGDVLLTSEQIKTEEVDIPVDISYYHIQHLEETENCELGENLSDNKQKLGKRSRPYLTVSRKSKERKQENFQNLYYNEEDRPCGSNYQEDNNIGIEPSSIKVKSELMEWDLHNGSEAGESLEKNVEDNEEIFNHKQKGKRDTRLDELLKSFNLIEVKPYLTEAEISFESLKYLSKEDIKEAIPPIGLRACFREKLFKWRKNVYNIDNDTPSAELIANKVIAWLQNHSNIKTAKFTPATMATTSLSVTNSGENCKLSKSLHLILEQSLKGKTLLNFIKNNCNLTDSLRADLINIILEDIFYHDLKLAPKDIPFVVNEILEIFPNEIREYYFVQRKGKTNPSGKLWDKYVNQRAKRARFLIKPKEHMEMLDSRSQDEEIAKFDESVLLSIKSSLANDVSNWDDVKDKWERTFKLRQKQLKSSEEIYRFLSEWPLYSNVKCVELINIDFELLHPNKSKLLFDKWKVFTEKILHYYSLHIKDKKSKEILINSWNISDKYSLDYIYTILLNAIIIPTARFSDESGKNSKKVSIPDANDSFVIHLLTIDNYEIILGQQKEKYYNKNLTIQPFLIVVGQSIYTLEEFYVYFNNILFKFDSFLKSLDVCFKIMNTLSLEYPKACQGPWLFIEEYFYEIKGKIVKPTNVYSLLNYLKT
ncbi:uncharacterized protein ACRADG_009264 isoform 2-T2 [Cochliomyia hominivorax]